MCNISLGSVDGSSEPSWKPTGRTPITRSAGRQQMSSSGLLIQLEDLCGHPTQGPGPARVFLTPSACDSSALALQMSLELEAISKRAAAAPGRKRKPDATVGDARQVGDSTTRHFKR